jgi:predicted phage terminase large subunit-like protein
MATGAASEKRFDREAEALRLMIQAQARPFPDGPEERRARVSRARTDLAFFGRTYFPHYFTTAPSALHAWFAGRFTAMIERAVTAGEGDKEADAAPRGNAKSTWTTFLLPLWCVCFGLRRYILPVSETAAQAESFLSFIKTELESNGRLAQDFPNACGEGPVWRAMMVITRNGVKIHAAGAGQKLRGFRHGSKRPDLVIGDDLENDESVASPDQRAKLRAWFFKALMKIGQPDTVFIVVGTVLHYDSLLSELLKKPGWKGQKFKSVIRYSQSGLWEEWERVFSDVTVGKEAAEQAADAFFARNRDAMLDGTCVLWPEREPYYFLMKMRVSDGPAFFDSEKQNEPVNPEDCLFSGADIRFWEDGDADLSGAPLFCAVDPSMGKAAKRRDPSAIVAGRFKHGVLWVETADIEKRHPDKIIGDVLAYHARERFAAIGVETVQFQEFFKDTLEKEAHARGLTLRAVEIKSRSDKYLRIQTLQPWIKNGWIRLRRHHRTLFEQLRLYPAGDHDDGPDALEMLKSLVEGAAGAPMEHRSLGRRREFTRTRGYFGE